ncbi:MAG: hypothetical protein AVDCRST_MAG56-2361 [uncultured Cytophagales bacterium]|uniref:Uncharacterized protein n=1 Tax=uncultured Cytophagales bacterium TaxID=158755 RepID=A0A6J4H0B3_9SPHI|nr:MAG: hypothetical protein AVDCRST_MAG56-2361 [uncultured Cytophagales bacterium]
MLNASNTNCSCSFFAASVADAVPEIPAEPATEESLIDLRFLFVFAKIRFVYEGSSPVKEQKFKNAIN